MELKKPLESAGWLSGSGYQVVIDEPARNEAEAMVGHSEAERGGEPAKLSVQAASSAQSVSPKA